MQSFQPLIMETELPGKVYDRFKSLIYERAGISLGANKQALLSARLRKRMRTIGLASFAEYYDYVQGDSTEEEVTQFYREARHFDGLAEWQDKGRKRFRLWCAAAFSGEEPYTLAIIARETLNPQADVKILATDISTLMDAKRGLRKRRAKGTPPSSAGTPPLSSPIENPTPCSDQYRSLILEHIQSSFRRKDTPRIAPEPGDQVVSQHRQNRSTSLTECLLCRHDFAAKWRLLRSWPHCTAAIVPECTPHRKVSIPVFGEPVCQQYCSRYPGVMMYSCIQNLIRLRSKPASRKDEVFCYE